MKIDCLDESQFAEADALLALAFGSPVSRLNDLRLYRKIQPDGWFAAFEGSRMIGTVGAVNYGTFAHVGFMTVHPELQGRGFGRILMQFILDDLAQKGVALVTLDASPKGRPLYEKMGFRPSGETWVYEVSPVVGCTQLPTGIQPMQASDLDDLLVLDRPAFGADRRKVFESLLSLFPGRGFVKRDSAGSLLGYLYTLPNRIGPWVMLHAEDAADLLSAAMSLSYGQSVALVAPSENRHEAPFLEKVGFRRARGGAHMFLGVAPPVADREKVWAQTSLGAG